MARKALKIGIIGAGIGGAALALALHRRGMEAHLFDRASAFGEIGAGVQMTPNAVKVLRGLGLGEGLAAVGFLPEAMVGFNWDTGRKTFHTPLREVCPRVFGAEFFHVHRADLHSLLTRELPADRITFRAECAGVEQGGDKAVATFVDGSRFEADLIIGADGIHSVVRGNLWGQDPARFTGHMCWRALVPVEHFPLPFVGPYAAFWMGPNAHIVTYYVKGGKEVNIVAVSESTEWVAESWIEPSSKEEFLAAYQGWHGDITELLRRTDPATTFKWGLFDRDPMARWSQGHVTLLGDAAHPMLPFLSQGAAMALEDGWVLAAALDHFDELNDALLAYEAERRPRTARVQLEARERGRTYHLATPEEQERRDAEMRKQQAANPHAVGIKAEWVYEYDATRCAERFAPGALHA
jgi:salicylate hydroxylase